MEVRWSFGERRRFRFTDSVTFKILIVNTVLFLITTSSLQIFYILALTPTLAINKGMIWQFFTYMYVHGGFAHVFFNMFSFIMFGPTIEHTMGSRKFFIFYTLCGIGSSVLFIILTGISDIPLVGASGAIFGVVTAYGLLFPRNIIYVYYVPMPAIVAIGLFAVIELFSGITGLQPGIANFGHLGGMIVGFILVKFFNYGSRPKVVYFWEE